jgi:hypothetical protein
MTHVIERLFAGIGMKRFLKILTLLPLTLMGVLCLDAQQVTCTPSVTSARCKQFDAAFGQSSLWSVVNFTNRVEIVVVDPKQFKAERAKFDAEKEAAAKNKKSVGDLNRVGGREAGGGVFEHEILECPTSYWVKRIVISTEAVGDSEPHTIEEISDQLLFYVIGYDQGLLQGMANLVP